MIAILVALIVTFATACSVSAQTSLTQSATNPDQRLQQAALVTESLYHEYISNQYRIETDQVRAAVVLVANRGLDHPEFVNRVLQDFETACEKKDNGGTAQ